MPVIVATAVTKAYGPRTVLGGVDCSIHTGERVGLVGSNGSGKSTLARILAGIEGPDTGTVARRRGAEVLYLEQAPTFEGDPTAREAVSLGLKDWSAAMARHESLTSRIAAGEGDLDALLAEQEAASADVERLGGWDRMPEIEAMLGHLGIERPDQRISSMSGGEVRRVALARLLVARPTLAILDEPTNHLDVDTAEWLERYLIETYEGALLLVTHDRYLLDRVCTRTLELDQGKVTSYDGGWEEYLTQKEERLAQQARTEANRQNFLRKELEWLRRQPKARTTKQKARIDRAEAAKAVKAPQEEKAAQLALDSVRSGKTILELHGLSLEVAGRLLVRELTLHMTQGERVGIVGRNGAGKSTLLKAITGQLSPAKGEVVLGKNTKLAYFDQERSGLEEDKSVYDNVCADMPRIELGGEAIDGRTYLERFMFDGQRQRQKVASLSGGERARVALAKMLRQPANLVLLDEPTNDLDVGTLGALESMLVDYGGTALVVTHDRWFLDRVATAILAFEADGRVVRYAGNHEAYRRARAEAEAQRAEVKAREAAQAREKAPSRSSQKAGLTSNEKRELEGMLDEIAEAEEQVSKLEHSLAEPEVYNDFERSRRVNSDLDEARREVARLYERWQELEAKREQA